MSERKDLEREREELERQRRELRRQRIAIEEEYREKERNNDVDEDLDDRVYRDDRDSRSRRSRNEDRDYRNSRDSRRRDNYQGSSRHRKKRRSKLPFVFAVLICLVLALGILGFLFLNKSLSKINYKDLDSAKIGSNDGVGAITGKGVDVIALLGLDARDLTETSNSDTMMIAAIDHNKKEIRLISLYRDTYLNVYADDGSGNYIDSYSKANSAYLHGGPEQFLTMVNKNLDLNVKEYASVNFQALTKIIDDLGGIDIEMTREEVLHLNNYNVETSQVAGVAYEEVALPPQEEFDGAMTRSFHLNGSQATSYARIRATVGWDQKRTSRQRIVLEKIFEKIKSSGPLTLMKTAESVLPLVETNMSKTDITKLGWSLMRYDVATQKGFPFDYVWGDEAAAVLGIDAILPVTLAGNVTDLHALLYPDITYTPTEGLQAISNDIINQTGYDESMKPESSVTGEE